MICLSRFYFVRCFYDFNNLRSHWASEHRLSIQNRLVWAAPFHHVKSADKWFHQWILLAAFDRYLSSYQQRQCKDAWSKKNSLAIKIIKFNTSTIAKIAYIKLKRSSTKRAIFEVKVTICFWLLYFRVFSLEAYITSLFCRRKLLR